MKPPTNRDREGALDVLDSLLADGPVGWGAEVEPYIHVATEDAIRLFAEGTGDDNPLFTDAVYARSSIRGALHAPPLFVLATGAPKPRHRPLSVALSGALMPGASITREVWTFLRPVSVGERLERADSIVALGRAPQVHTPGATHELHQRTEWFVGESPYVLRDRLRVHGGAFSRARRTGKAVYDDQMLAEIAAAYDGETRRGSRTRLADEVHLGDELRVVRGPLTVTDLVTYRAAVGPGPLRAGALRIGHRNRMLDERFFSRNDVGAFETAERLHWDEAHAQRVGHPTAYDYSHTRQVWFAQLLTDWMGDGGWLARLSVSTPGMNYVGDTHWLSAVVAATEPLGNDLAVTVELRAVNQDGELTCHGEAVVLLPTRGDAAADHRSLAEAPFGRSSGDLSSI